ncbi:MAG: hypothetical protein GY765_03095 [bacterium]|nr:hypothetical protein [bacterium]
METNFFTMESFRPSMEANISPWKATDFHGSEFFHHGKLPALHGSEYFSMERFRTSMEANISPWKAARISMANRGTLGSATVNAFPN